ncbi:bola protein [Thamnocephalis sphaerospora]|uniref:Bola protein n=1 Tax=Thamnocephalis sphaerospora TaxID=78915 RepID=A0A4P9XMM7_9FUNG|nr:bola protein [Thamnocephalis sphaerospora]|eukprot:RKP07168.1 bola protein [Thamnocephalis sphaerospora]
MLARNILNTAARAAVATECARRAALRVYSSTASNDQTAAQKPGKGPLTQSIEKKAGDHLSGVSCAHTWCLHARSILLQLTAALAPTVLQVINDSYPSESHFRIHVVSSMFEGKSLPQRHRLVYGEIGQEMQSGIHAIQLFTKTPKETGAV